MDDFIISSLQRTTTLTVGNVFQRCVINDVLYFSKCYTRTQKKEYSYTVCYRHEKDTKFGEIEFFFVIQYGFLKVYAYISQLLQKISNNRHFELPHSALENGI